MTSVFEIAKFRKSIFSLLRYRHIGPVDIKLALHLCIFMLRQGRCQFNDFILRRLTGLGFHTKPNKYHADALLIWHSNVFLTSLQSSSPVVLNSFNYQKCR